MISTSFWSADGHPVSIEKFLENMFGDLPDFFKTEDELRIIWSDPITRKAFLEKISVLGYGKDELEILQKMIDADKSDLFDVLAYVSFASKPISRVERVEQSKEEILKGLNEQQKQFLDFVLAKYEEKGVEELDEEKLPILLNLKYHAIADAVSTLGDVDAIRSIFFNFQQKLYNK
jgi:type I restriction enzyme R subunit